MLPGMYAWFSYALPIAERLELIKKAGFSAVSLWWGEEDKRRQPALARELGLAVDNIHAPFQNPDALWQEGPEGEAYLKELLSCIDDCASLSLPTVVIHAAGFREPAAVTDRGLRRIGKLVEAAESAGVRLAFENLHRLEHLHRIFGAFPSKQVGFCYDSGHEHLYHSLADCLSLFGDRLFAVHIDDNDGDADAHLLPFDGSVDWTAVMNGLQSARRIDYFTLEVDFNRNHHKARLYDPLSAAEYLALAYQRACALLERIG